MGVLIISCFFAVSIVSGACNILMGINRGDIGGVTAGLMFIGLGLYTAIGVYFLTWLSTI